MTYIEISGSDENLEELKLLSEEIFRDNGIHAKPEVYHFQQDSIEAEQLLPTLQVVFSGVIAVVQIINLVINIQEKRKEASINSEVPLRIKIKASNSSELDLKISGQLTEEKIEAYQKSVQSFVNDFLSSDDGIDLKNLGNSEIEQVNSLIRELQTKLTDIRVLVSLPPKQVGKAPIFTSSFDSIDLIEAIKIGVEETFYLKVDDVEGCKNIFYILERENILSFHEESTDIRIIEAGSAFDIFVGYKVEILLLFERVVRNKNFYFHGRFQNDEQHN